MAAPAPTAGCSSAAATPLLRDSLAAALVAADHRAETAGHAYPAIHPDNICNRGATRMGAQLELPHSLRRGEAANGVAAAVRAALSRAP